MWTRSFYLRRAFKIYPGLYLLVLLSGLKIYSPEVSYGPRGIAAELLFLQNYLPHLWQHTWSLAVEEHFYLIIALLFMPPIARIALPRWPAVVGLIAIVCLTARLMTGGEFSYPSHLYPSHLRMDSLFIGTLAGYLYHFHRQRTEAFIRKERHKVLLIATALIQAAFWERLDSSRFAQTVGLLFLAVGFGLVVACVIFGAITIELPKPLGLAFVGVGKASYAIYLVHLPVLAVMEKFFPSLIGGGSGCFLYFLSSTSLGLFITHLIEKPLLRWRDKVLPNPALVQSQKFLPSHASRQ